MLSDLRLEDSQVIFLIPGVLGTWIEVREGTGWEDRRRKENSHGTEKSERFNQRV